MKAVAIALATRKASKLWSAGAALFALFFLVLQPVCAAYERHIVSSYAASAVTALDAALADDASRGSLGRTPCCPAMQAESIASATSAAAVKNFAAAEIAVALPLAPFAPTGLRLSFRPAWGTPPPVPLSYYARSARILR